MNRLELRYCRVIASVLCCLLLLCGCTAAGYRAVNSAEYPHQQKIFDLTIGWVLKPVGEGLQVAGYARNNRYFQMRDLVITVSLVAPDGAERAREAVLVHPSLLGLDELTDFVVTLPGKPERGEKLRFNYRYVAVEGVDEALFWMNSFDVPAVSE
jgi:hypothetical protein